MRRRHLSPALRTAIEDALSPADLSPTLAVAIVAILLDYRHDVQRQGIYRSANRRRQIADRVAALDALLAAEEQAHALLGLLKDDAHHLRELVTNHFVFGDDWRTLASALREEIDLCRRLQPLVTSAHRPTDAPTYWLGVRLVRACAAAGIDLTLGRSTPVVELLKVVRTQAEKTADRRPTRFNAFTYAQQSIDRYRQDEADPIARSGK